MISIARFSFLLLLIVSKGSLLVAAAPAAALPSVTIASGVVVGTTTTLPSATVAVNKFLGIPFAASPPVRFDPPTAPAPWPTPMNAFAFKDSCIQQFNYPEASRNFTMAVFNNPGGTPPVESEDCLYLNVFAPASPAPAAGRAVMFWIYGGNLQFGTAGILQYDGSSFATNQDVVVVTHNYRTNVFGFSNSPQLPIDSQNAGFLDQRFALEWVQQNIKKFGGNPSKVTIFGESAGGYSVKQLLSVPPSPLNFRAAILESEAVSLAGSGPASWETLVAAVGCTAAASQIDCVRAVPATTIKSVIEHAALAFPPTVDNKTETGNVALAITSHTAAQVPFLIGTNAQEGRPLAAALGLDEPLDVATFLNATIPGEPALQAAIAATYPLSVYQTPYFAISAIITDLEFLCPASALANLASISGYEVWRYYFNATFPNTQTFPDAGVYHSSEIAEVFGTYPTAGATAQEVALSKYMQTAWASFAKRPTRGPGWPKLGSRWDVDLGDLGPDGIFGEITIPQLTVDYICPLYAPIIAVEGL
ncbi:hypothetical protein MMC13_003447 [Lambiella insularis]|nr:hypothetical protein [Lambiella insularis]